MCKWDKRWLQKTQMPTENDGGWAKPLEKYCQRHTDKNIQKNIGKP